MTQLEELILVVNGIVAAPYAASLKPLHGFLSRHESGQAEYDHNLSEDSFKLLRKWSNIKACQIPSIAAAVLADLVRDASSLRILAAFATLPSFRDAILSQQPDIMARLLQYALGSDEYARFAFHTCIYIFSLSPSANLALPELMPKFLEKVLEDIIDHPCGRSPNVLRRLIYSNSAKWLETVPEAVLNQFINTFRTIQKNNDAHLANVHCMAIASKVFSTCFLDSEFSSSDSIASPSLLAAWAAKMECFFSKSGTKTSHTIRFAVLRVLLHCSAGPGINEAESLASVEAASQILDIFEPQILRRWACENLRVVVKLLQKASRPGLLPSLRFFAFSTLMRLDPDGLHCNYIGLLMLLAQSLIDEESSEPVQPILDSSDKLLNNFWHGFELYLTPVSHSYDQKSCRALLMKMLRFVIEQCRPGQMPGLERLSGLTNALVLTKALHASTRSMETSALSHVLIDFINEDEVPDWWNLSLSEPDMTSNCGIQRFCPQEFEKHRLELTCLLSTLLIEVAAIGGRALSRENFRLLRQQVIRMPSSMADFGCCYNVSQCVNGVLVGTFPTGRESGRGASTNASFNWQQNLDEQLTNTGATTRKLIISHVNDVCRDLQDRCDHVEKPLLESKRRAADLQHQVDAMTLKSSETAKDLRELQSLLQISNGRVAALEQAEELLYIQVTAANQEAATLRERLSETTSEAEIFKNAATLKYEELELDCTVKIMRLTEDLALSSKQISKLEIDMLWLSEQIPLMQLEQQEVHEADVVRLRMVFNDQLNELIAERTGLGEVLGTTRLRIDHLEKAALASDEQLAEHMDTIIRLTEQLNILEKTITAKKQELNEKARLMDTFTVAEEAWRMEKQNLEESLQVAKDKHSRILAAVGN